MAEEAIEKYDLKEEAAAEYLSEQSYGNAYNEYFAAGGVLFAKSSEGNRFFVEELTRSLKLHARLVQFGNLTLSVLSDDDFDAIRVAVSLPTALHYNEFEYVVSGGDYDGGKFRRNEQWSSCDLSEARDDLIRALALFCLQCATLAKKHSAAYAQSSFMRAYAFLFAGFLSVHRPMYGIPAKAAEPLVAWIASGIRSLWGEIKVDANLKKWEELESNVEAMSADPPIEEGQAPVEDGPQDDNPPVAGTIIPGKYGATVVAKIDNDKRTIVFAAKYGKKGKRYKVPPKSGKVWHFLKLLIETESADGATEMPEEFKYWHGLFRRARKLEDGGSVAVKTDLDELKKHIVSCKGAGKRGLPILKIVAGIPRKNARK